MCHILLTVEELAKYIVLLEYILCDILLIREGIGKYTVLLRIDLESHPPHSEGVG